MKKSWSYEVKENMVAWSLRFQFEEGVDNLTITGSFKLEGIEGDFSFEQTVSGFLHGLSQKIGDKASSKTSEAERREAVLTEYEGLKERETWNATTRGSRETLEDLQWKKAKILEEMESDIIKGNEVVMAAMRKELKATESKIKKKEKEGKEEEKQEEKPIVKKKKKSK
jgi:hypothetical protein